MRSGESDSAQGANQKRRKETHERSFREVVSENLRVSIINERDLEGRIPSSLEEPLRSALMGELTAFLETRPTQIPSFRGNEFVRGHLRINCVDSSSLDFLNRTIQKIGSNWEGAKMRVARRDEVPRLRTAKVFFPRYENGPEEALKLLNLQNPSFGVAGWKQFHTEVLPGKGLLLVMGVDEITAATIEKARGTANFGFSHVNVKVSRARSNAEVEGAVPDNGAGCASQPTSQ